MPANATGKVVLRLDHQGDIRELTKPAGIEVIWICGDISKNNELINTFKSWDIPTEDTSFWIAGEDQIIRDLRRFIRREKGVVVKVFMRYLIGVMVTMKKVIIKKDIM